MVSQKKRESLLIRYGTHMLLQFASLLLLLLWLLLLLLLLLLLAFLLHSLTFTVVLMIDGRKGRFGQIVVRSTDFVGLHVTPFPFSAPSPGLVPDGLQDLDNGGTIVIDLINLFRRIATTSFGLFGTKAFGENMRHERGFLPQEGGHVLEGP